MNGEQREEFIQACESAGYDVRRYSGRSMYGDECVGVTTSDGMARVTANIIEEYVHLFGETPDSAIWDNVRTDSMGLDTVIYWPRIKYTEE